MLMDDVDKNLIDFGKKTGVDIIMLMGMKKGKDGKEDKGFAFIPTRFTEAATLLMKDIETELRAHMAIEPLLHIRPQQKQWKLFQWKFFYQKRSTSRKVFIDYIENWMITPKTPDHDNLLDVPKT